MPIETADPFTRMVSFGGKPKVIVRPAVSMVFYTRANFVAVKSSVARSLELYLRLTSPNALAAIHQSEMDPLTGEEWKHFDPVTRSQLFDSLRNTPSDEEDFNVVLSATLDGQSGNYGFAFSGINFDLAEDVDEAESVLRLDFPWNLVQEMGPAEVVNLFEQLGGLFPTCSGHAGMSYIHTMTFMPQSGDEIAKLARRFLGFDLAHDFVALKMRNRVLTAHWLTLLDDGRLRALGGESVITQEMRGCEMHQVGSGLLIRAAKLPPVADLNRHAVDIGHLPGLARLLKPIRFANGLLVGMGDTDSGQEWLNRYDRLTSRDWDNG
jgi:hypothetical protein